MGCPCSKRTHPRQAGSNDPDPRSADPGPGHPSRGYTWNGPERRVDPAPPPPAAPADE